MEPELQRPPIGAHTCPYCGSFLRGGYRACAACGRDVDLLLDLQRQLKGATDSGGKPRCTRRRPFAYRLLSRYGGAIVLLLLADLLIQFAFDARRGALFAAAFLIPVVMGYSLGVRARPAAEFAYAIAAAPIAAAAAVVVLGLPLWLLHESNAWYPQTQREWREAIQFGVTITFALGAGLGIARAVRSHVDDASGRMEDWLREWFLPEHFDNMLHDRRAERFKQLLAAAATVGSTLIALAPIVLKQFE